MTAGGSSDRAWEPKPWVCLHDGCGRNLDDWEADARSVWVDGRRMWTCGPCRDELDAAGRLPVPRQWRAVPVAGDISAWWQEFEAIIDPPPPPEPPPVIADQTSLDI